MQLTNRRITIMGLGRHGGGVAATRFAVAQGALVTISDTASAAALHESLLQLRHLPLAGIVTGGHCGEEFLTADIVVVNPAIRPDSPWLKLAQRSGARITSEIEMLIEACPGPIVAVTGSNGKSTTAAMIASILAAAGRRNWLGGNIGGSLLDDLPAMSAGDVVVLELSSFQLARLRLPAAYFRAAVITNCTPNHLDWHCSWPEYFAAKQRILKGLSPFGSAVLNDDDAEVRRWRGLVKNRQVQLPKTDHLPPLRVPGEHNRQNARLAAATAADLGCSPDAIERGLANFTGLRHRLQVTGDFLGRLAINDSMATTPEAVVAALAAVDQPVWLLAGGKDKGVNLMPVALEASRRACGACFYGATGPQLAGAWSGGGGRMGLTKTLDEAVRWCWERSTPGDILLLSPGCSSLDQFADYRHRAAMFTESVTRQAAIATSTIAAAGVQFE